MLLVDLRDNEGGNSFIVAIVLHALLGTEAMLSADSGYQIPRYSELYFANHKGQTIADVAEGKLAVGDLDFSEEKRWRSRVQHGLDAHDHAQQRQLLARMREMSPTFAAALDERPGPPNWTPRIGVLTSARTYSAAFDLVAQLYKKGAILIGVPSSQAGNCFIDSLVYHLDHSRLTGSISFKRSLLFPTDDDKGRLLEPHILLTAERFRALDYDPNAAVILALEHFAPRSSQRRDASAATPTHKAAPLEPTLEPTLEHAPSDLT